MDILDCCPRQNTKYELYAVCVVCMLGGGCSNERKMRGECWRGDSPLFSHLATLRLGRPQQQCIACIVVVTRTTANCSVKSQCWFWHGNFCPSWTYFMWTLKSPFRVALYSHCKHWCVLYTMFKMSDTSYVMHWVSRMIVNSCECKNTSKKQLYLKTTNLI